METQTFYAVVDELNGTPLAIFQFRQWAYDWKKKYSATSEIEEYQLGIK